MSMKHIFYGGNGTTPVDSGLPLVGRFFSVNEDTGALRFWHYTGRGEPDPTGAKGFTGPGNNSGNQIGRGFGSMLHMLGGGDGIILAIQPNGDLTFFQYTGNGEQDETGTLGFEGPNQGTVIGNGFHSFPHVFVSPREGMASSARPAKTTIFLVNEAGDLLFFRYSGNGEHDPTGTLGFEGPNQGNQIGRGFRNFRHIVGVGGGAFLAVPENGDLLWFQYTGQGEQDPTGANGFTGPGNNSGNQIGRGFTDFRHLFGGSTDQGGFARILYGVKENGDLLFWRYEGNGEQDPTGTLGFETRFQGTQIGNGF